MLQNFTAQEYSYIAKEGGIQKMRTESDSGTQEQTLLVHNDN